MRSRYISTLLSTSALDGGGWSTPRPGRFTPGKDPVPIVQEAGWAPGPVWTGTENLAPTLIRSPDRPARNESLYRLSYPGRSGIRRAKRKADHILPSTAKLENACCCTFTSLTLLYSDALTTVTIALVSYTVLFKMCQIVNIISKLIPVVGLVCIVLLSCVYCCYPMCIVVLCVYYYLRYCSRRTAG